MGQSIGLAMIVRNEAHVINRCLDSVRPYVTHWAIVDTGSTDGTAELAATLEGVWNGVSIDPATLEVTA